jgi:DNA-binding transcriptional LysR family regulator
MLFNDRFIGVARMGHALGEGAISPLRYADCRHVHISRRGQVTGPVDEALARIGLERRIATTVSSFTSALALARISDMVASVPERHTGNLRDGMVSLDLPMPVAPITVSLLWHPRQDGHAAHRWLRGCVLVACA